MSDIDSDDSQCTGRSDLESTILRYSLVYSTIDLTPLIIDENQLISRRFNTTCFSADQTQKSSHGYRG